MSKTEPSAGAMRAGLKLAESYIENMTEEEKTLVAQIIDEETGLKEMLETLKRWVSIEPRCFCSDVIACPGCEAKQAISKAEGRK